MLWRVDRAHSAHSAHCVELLLLPSLRARGKVVTAHAAGREAARSGEAWAEAALAG